MVDTLLTCLLTSSPGSSEPNTLLASQMASRWPSVGTSMCQRSRQDREQLEESEVLQPAAGHLETSNGALGSLCRQFQRRLPLRAVSLNLGAGSSWKRLETPEPGQQSLQAAARSAKNALGAMSQVILPKLTIHLWRASLVPESCCPPGGPKNIDYMETGALIHGLLCL